MNRIVYVLIGAVALCAALPVAAQEAEAPDVLRVELDSPRATMFTFLRAMGEIEQGRGVDRAWEVVGQTLDVGHASPESVRTAADALLGVLDKLGTVDPLVLPDAEDVQRDDLGRFVYFPGREEQQWVWDQLNELGRFPWPDGVIAFTEAEPGVWLFSRETTANIVELAESLGPLPPKHIAQDMAGGDEFLSVLGPTFDQTPLWGWLALLGAIFVGLTVGKGVSAALRRIGERLIKRGWKTRGMAFDDAAGPASLALLTVGLAVGLHGFIRLDEPVAVFVKSVLVFLFLIALGWLLYNLVDIIETGLHSFTSHTSAQLDAMVLPLVRKTLRIFIVVVFSLVVAQNVFGLNITGWLAGLGIAGLAVSLAAQDSVKNLFGSLTVFFDKPFSVGDFIDYAGTTGTVEEIGFRSTRIRQVSGHVVTVPNMKWIDNQVENISARPYIRREMNIGLAYDTPLEKVEQAVRIVTDVLNAPHIVEEGRFDMESNAPKIALDEFTDDSLNIKAYYWYQMAGDPDRGFYSWLAHCEVVNLEVFRRFHDADIRVALPTRTLHLAGDPARQLTVQVVGDVNGGGDAG